MNKKDHLLNFLTFAAQQPQGFVYRGSPASALAPGTNKQTSPDHKKKQLESLFMPCVHCTACPLATQGRNQVVFGHGNSNTQLMFVGEGPGRDEDEQGLPFVGRAGQLLTKIIEAMKLTREDVYISNVVHRVTVRHFPTKAIPVKSCCSLRKSKLFSPRLSARSVQQRCKHCSEMKSKSLMHAAHFTCIIRFLLCRRIIRHIFCAILMQNGLCGKI